MQTILKGQGKPSCLLSTGPKSGDFAFDHWNEEDFITVVWFWNFMTPEISKPIMYLPTAKDIWD